MRALIPGSFDPITLGHINIIERASPMFEKIYVAVMNNDSAEHDESLSSKTQYMFTPEERLELVRRSVAHIPNAQAVLWSGMLIDFCDAYDIVAVIRGVRNAADFEYEAIHARWNREHNSRAQALFMPADDRFCGLSSTKIREAIAKGELSALEGGLHPDALNYIKQLQKGIKQHGNKD